MGSGFFDARFAAFGGPVMLRVYSWHPNTNDIRVWDNATGNYSPDHGMKPWAVKRLQRLAKKRCQDLDEADRRAQEAEQAESDADYDRRWGLGLV